MSSDTVQLVQINEVLYGAERGAPGEPNVRALVLLGDAYTLVFDTLYNQRDMIPVLELAGRRHRPILVVNSHADVDHAWGNAAFPQATIIGHDLCRGRLLSATEQERLHKLQHDEPEEFATVVLRPPDLTFSHSMSLDLGGLPVRLHHLPGHQVDCIVAHLPTMGILLGGDCVEDPFPLLNSGPLDGWAAALRAWAVHPEVHTVIPAHGPISTTDLLRRNASYLESLLAGRDDGWQPDEGSLPFYVEWHPRNVARAADKRLQSLSLTTSAGKE